MKMPKPYRKTRTHCWWFSYKHPITKKWTPKSTGESNLAEAEKRIASFMKVLSSGEAPAPAPMTVAAYAKTWLAKRTNVTAADDRTRLEKHVVAYIGALPLAEVKVRHIRDLVQKLEAKGLSSRSISKISGTLSTMLRYAVEDELIASSPYRDLRLGVLPKKVDADPTWRHEAIYSRTEAEQLLSDPRILPDRRMFYGLKFLGGGMRHSEAARLRWRDYDTSMEPLAALNLGETKSGVARQVPVHATLAKMIAQWKLSGWAEWYGRQPTSEDLIVPTRNMTGRDATEAQRQLIADLDLIGLRVKAGQKRNRRGHDLRRTFISLARGDGAADGPLRWVTHGPSASSMAELYSTFTWAQLCDAVSKLKVELREGQVVALTPEATTDSVRRADAAKKRWKNESELRPRRDSNIRPGRPFAEPFSQVRTITNG